jgi:hypothetical protein
MAKLPDLPKVRVAGPFWTAEADVIRLADPATNFAFRTLFVDTTPRKAVGENNVLLPGSLLALVYVTSVTINPTNGATPQYVWTRSGTKPDGHLPPQAIRAAISAGTASLLLLQAPADGWPTGITGNLPVFTCLGGEIVLDAMTPQAGAVQRLYTALGLTPAAIAQRTGPAHLLGALAVHSGGAVGLRPDPPALGQRTGQRGVPARPGRPRPGSGAGAGGARVPDDDRDRAADRRRAGGTPHLMAAAQPLPQPR